tara:strand:+ start:1265 stop:1714 length:450 start_codon:yes stop_codon:yes gene_type:complete
MRRFLIYSGVAVGLYLLYKHSTKKEVSIQDKIKDTPPEPKKPIKAKPSLVAKPIQIYPESELMKPRQFSVVNGISYLRKPENKNRKSSMSGLYATLYLDARNPDGTLKPNFKEKVAKAEAIIRSKVAEGFNNIEVVYKNNKVADMIFKK